MRVTVKTIYNNQIDMYTDVTVSRYGTGKVDVLAIISKDPACTVNYNLAHVEYWTTALESEESDND